MVKVAIGVTLVWIFVYVFLIWPNIIAQYTRVASGEDYGCHNSHKPDVVVMERATACLAYLACVEVFMQCRWLYTVCTNTSYCSDFDSYQELKELKEIPEIDVEQSDVEGVDSDFQAPVFGAAAQGQVWLFEQLITYTYMANLKPFKQALKAWRKDSEQFDQNYESTWLGSKIDSILDNCGSQESMIVDGAKTRFKERIQALSKLEGHAIGKHKEKHQKLFVRYLKAGLGEVFDLRGPNSNGWSHRIETMKELASSEWFVEKLLSDWELKAESPSKWFEESPDMLAEFLNPSSASHIPTYKMVAKLLLENRANPNKTLNGNHPLALAWIAAQKPPTDMRGGHFDFSLVELLLEHKASPSNVVDDDGEKLLVSLCNHVKKSRDPPEINLMEMILEGSGDADAKDKGGVLVLVSVTKSVIGLDETNNVDFFKKSMELLLKRARPESKREALALAVNEGLQKTQNRINVEEVVEAVKQLLENGAPVTGEGQYGLIWAIYEQHLFMMNLFLGKRADPDVTYQGKSALTWATERAIATRGDAEPIARQAMHTLLSSGSQIDSQTWCHLWQSRECRTVDVVRELLEFRAQLNMEVDSTSKETALHKAIAQRDHDCAELLCEHGADKKAKATLSTSSSFLSKKNSTPWDLLSEDLKKESDWKFLQK